jgi:hypothetical protein
MGEVMPDGGNHYVWSISMLECWAFKLGWRWVIDGDGKGGKWGSPSYPVCTRFPVFRRRRSCFVVTLIRLTIRLARIYIYI